MVRRVFGANQEAAFVVQSSTSITSTRKNAMLLPLLPSSILSRSSCAFQHHQHHHHHHHRHPPINTLFGSTIAEDAFSGSSILPVRGITILDDAAAAATTTAPAGVHHDAAAAAAVYYYEPIMPSTETLLGMGLIVVLCAVVAWVWQTQVVPTSRTKLAISKSRGQVKKYLEELNQNNKAAAASSADRPQNDDDYYYHQDESSNTTTTTTTTTNESTDNNTLGSTDATLVEKDIPAPRMIQGSISPSPSPQDDRAFERWLFTDWLQQQQQQQQRQDDNKSERKAKAGRQKEPALPILKDAKWNSGDNPVLVATLLIGLGVIFTAVTERVSGFLFSL